MKILLAEKERRGKGKSTKLYLAISSRFLEALYYNTTTVSLLKQYHKKYTSLMRVNKLKKDKKLNYNQTIDIMLKLKLLFFFPYHSRYVGSSSKS